LQADTALVQGVVDACGEAPAVFGHSYGGSVITGLRGVRRLIYLAAFVPAEGESGAMLGGPRALVNDAVLRESNGSTRIRSDLAISTLYGRCTSADAAWASSLLVAQEAGHGRGVPDAFAWRSVPSTYVVCEEDRALDPVLQERMSRRCTMTYRLRSDHSPFISQPELLADIILSILDEPPILSRVPPCDTTPGSSAKMSA
jgi:pimeloyl-ACP methyl ester carboxylesterase